MNSASIQMKVLFLTVYADSTVGHARKSRHMVGVGRSITSMSATGTAAAATMGRPRNARGAMHLRLNGVPSRLHISWFVYLCSGQGAGLKGCVAVSGNALGFDGFSFIRR